MKIDRFYSVIIGTELLNGRRKDSHFEFLNARLVERGFSHVASFLLKDDPKLIKECFELIKRDERAAMFCFGGIGATPDDLTRERAALVFTQGESAFEPSAKRIILERFGEEAYPNRIQMAYLPLGARPLANPINQIPGFGLENRYFFMPGFPSMAQAMVLEAITSFFDRYETVHAISVEIQAPEERIIAFMQSLPQEIEASSLPSMDLRLVFSMRCERLEILQESYANLISYLQEQNLTYQTL